MLFRMVSLVLITSSKKILLVLDLRANVSLCRMAMPGWRREVVEIEWRKGKAQYLEKSEWI